MYLLLLFLLVISFTAKYGFFESIVISFSIPFLFFPVGYIVYHYGRLSKLKISEFSFSILSGFAIFIHLIDLTNSKFYILLPLSFVLLSFGFVVWIKDTDQEGFFAKLIYKINSVFLSIRIEWKNEKFSILFFSFTVSVLLWWISSNFGIYRFDEDSIFLSGFPSDISSYMGILRGMLTDNAVNWVEHAHFYGSQKYEYHHAFAEQFSFFILKFSGLFKEEADPRLFLTSILPGFFFLLFFIVLFFPTHQLKNHNPLKSLIFFIIFIFLSSIDFHKSESAFGGYSNIIYFFSNYHTATYLVYSTWLFKFLFEKKVAQEKDSSLNEFWFLLFVCFFSALIFKMNSAHGILILSGAFLLLIYNRKLIFSAISELVKIHPKSIYLFLGSAIICLFLCVFFASRYFSFSEDAHKILVFSFGALPAVFNQLAHSSAVYIQMPDPSPFRWLLSFILPPILAFIVFFALKSGSMAKYKNLYIFLLGSLIFAIVLTVFTKSGMNPKHPHEVTMHFIVNFNQIIIWILGIIIFSQMNFELNLKTKTISIFLILAIVVTSYRYIWRGRSFADFPISQNLYDLIEKIYSDKNLRNKIFIHDLPHKNFIAFISGYAQSRVVLERELFFGYISRDSDIKDLFDPKNSITRKNEILKKYDVDFIITTSTDSNTFTLYPNIVYRNEEFLILAAK